jgi:hypothetical protein
MQGRFGACGSFAGAPLQGASHHKQFGLTLVEITDTIGGFEQS